MNIERLITMANEIGAFFAADPDREQGVREMVSHLKRFWTPTMRRQIVDYYSEDGAQLHEFTRLAVGRLASEMAPQSKEGASAR